MWPRIVSVIGTRGSAQQVVLLAIWPVVWPEEANCTSVAAWGNHYDQSSVDVADYTQQALRIVTVRAVVDRVIETLCDDGDPIR
ncbi:hypothetical protein [Paraburkholderia azotifigens]|uniref:Uncharacterized protein n=1 Tax=Paraburkholderia azotifigens TaxID=2057004 RepID=A0A5C6V5I5_9BURK|nr:hypothetical protein [Paraburkholderia azotifigens]TXC79716.1 hypothetical protein FRZ40_35810 [Paraburkholderia azotifigens]